MKQSVKTIVDSIEKEIERIMKEFNFCTDETEKEFEYGTFIFEWEIKEKTFYGGEWDEILNENYIKIIPLSATVTNENSKVLTNLSTEVFNQLETTYTNY